MRIAAILLITALPALADLPAANRDMVKAAEAFLETLSPEQAKKARYEFNSDERENWHFIPKVRGGFPLKEMDAKQKRAAMALLSSGLSKAGRVKADAIIVLEGILGVLEKNPKRRDPELYYVAVFGTPSADKPWGWRVEGHHLSVNFTLEGDKIAAAPSFFGANPAIGPEGDHKGLRPLANEEDLARALAASLAEAEKKVVFSEKPPRDILTAAERSVKQLEVVGVPATAMTKAQQDALMKIVAEYANRHREELAGQDLAKIQKAGVEKLSFGWAGSLKPAEAYYYRVQGPGFLIEAANTQNNANHIHTVWRDFTGDFGRDFLGEHSHGHE